MHCLPRPTWLRFFVEFVCLCICLHACLEISRRQAYQGRSSSPERTCSRRSSHTCVVFGNLHRRATCTTWATKVVQMLRVNLERCVCLARKVDPRCLGEDTLSGSGVCFRPPTRPLPGSIYEPAHTHTIVSHGDT